MEIRRCIARWLGLIVLAVVVTPLQANEVQLPYQGLRLNANLELADGKKLADGMIVITHSGLGHGRMDTVSYLQQLLKEGGYSSLAITLSLGVDNRHGMFNCKDTHRHHFSDGADELGAWVDWLTRQGVRRMVLLGHSRGTSQTALYVAERNPGPVQAVILLAPDTRATNDAAAYQQRHQVPLAPILEKAQQLVKAGRAETVLEHTGILYCTDTRVTAGTIVSYYGPDPRLDAPYLIQRIRKPVLIVIAGSDEVVVGFKDKFVPLAVGQRIQVKVVEGAGHFFRDLYTDDAVDLIRTFLQGNGY